MAEQFKNGYPKRVLFNKGGQSRFINLIISKGGLGIDDLAQLTNVHPRTVRDWRREKFLVPLNALKKMCAKTKINLPSGIQVKDPFWYVHSGSSAGGVAVFKKYGKIGGDEEYRKRKWREWWAVEGKRKYKNLFQALPFNKPKRSEKLAEFFGIMMGDGGMSKSQITITLNKIVDYEYSNYVAELIEDLFKVRPGRAERRGAKVLNISISRVGLVNFCRDLGLVIGNKIKQQIDIPNWIKNRFKYKIACLRGLFDTDGCLIIHRYVSSGKVYVYKKIAFTSRSLPLLASIREVLNELGLKHRTGNNFDIRIEAAADVKKYFNAVGSHNPKHLKRYRTML
jgi:hypothetical protein